jgi:hypothetical protein
MWLGGGTCPTSCGSLPSQRPLSCPFILPFATLLSHNKIPSNTLSPLNNHDATFPSRDPTPLLISTTHSLIPRKHLTAATTASHLLHHGLLIGQRADQPQDQGAGCQCKAPALWHLLWYVLAIHLLFGPQTRRNLRTRR